MATEERRMHTAAFKKRLVAQVLKGKTVGELAETNEISPSMIHNWKRDPRFGGDPVKFPKRASGVILDGIPQKSNGELRGKRIIGQHWKFCPNCGEKLK